MPSPQPSPTGEGAGYSDFCGCRQFEKQLGFTAVDFRSSEKQKAARTTCFPCRTFNPNSHPVLSPRGRELERGQQAARLVLGRLGCRERLLQFGRCPLPSPPPRGRGQVAADSSVTGRLKKNARNINSRNFSGSFYRKADVTNAASVFSDGLWTIGRVCAARHSRGGLGLQGKWRTRACVSHAPYMRATACYACLF